MAVYASRPGLGPAADPHLFRHVWQLQIKHSTLQRRNRRHLSTGNRAMSFSCVGPAGRPRAAAAARGTSASKFCREPRSEQGSALLPAPAALPPLTTALRKAA